MLSQFLKGFPWLDMLEMTFWFTGGGEKGRGERGRGAVVEGEGGGAAEPVKV